MSEMHSDNYIVGNRIPEGAYLESHRLKNHQNDSQWPLRFVRSVGP